MLVSNQKLKDMTFCALDLEATGANPSYHRIVEVGMIRFNLSGVIKKYESLVNPVVTIPEDVKAIHGITDEMVKNSPKISEIIDDISEMMEGALLVIQNPGFDLKFLEWTYWESGKELPEVWAVDTVKLSQVTYPDLPNHKLSTLCEFLGIEITPHRAMPDAVGCMEVFKNVIDENDPGSEWNISDLKRLNGKFTGFGKKLKRRIQRKDKCVKGIHLGRAVKIQHQDNSGTITTREITPMEFIRYGKKTYLVAHCYLRNESRCFNTDKIVKVD